MAKLTQRKLVKLDGRTGEGGGQLVRVAVPLAVLAGTPIHISNVRGNRKDKRGGGLKAQHVSGIAWLINVSEAQVNDTCYVGSKSLEFQPPPSISNFELKGKLGTISQDSQAASILLIFQSILPVLLFYGQPINTITIQGGTNISHSLSYEYLDQVLLPSLQAFGVQVESRLINRSWSHGQLQHGAITFSVTRIPPGGTLKAPKWPTEQGKTTKIDVSIIVPQNLIEPLKAALAFEIGLVFPEVEANFKIIEDSMHSARVYALLVAHTSNGSRFGYDWLYDKTTKNKTPGKLATEISQRVTNGLDNELRKGGVVDEYLQDQLLIYQALAEGRTCIPGTSDVFDLESSELDNTDEPFGDGTMHAKTVRWVASQLLPELKWSAEVNWALKLRDGAKSSAAFLFRRATVEEQLPISKNGGFTKCAAASSNLLPLLITLTLVTPTLQQTTYDSTPSTCTITGDANLYGIGIRLSYYLFFFAGVLASLLKLDPALSLSRRVYNLISIAAIINLCANGYDKDTFVALEKFLVFNLVILPLFVTVPLEPLYMRKDKLSLAILYIFYSCFLMSQPWISFFRLSQGHKDGCEAKAFVFFAKIGLDDARWVDFVKVASILVAIGGLVWAWMAIQSIVLGFQESLKRRGSIEKIDGEDEKLKSFELSLTLHVIVRLASLVLGCCSIAFVEVTLRINAIDLSDASLAKTGQLVPFLGGLFSLPFPLSSLKES
ncbi:hypothetical protein B7463_g6083, partial [Scytalidium lignicola]